MHFISTFGFVLLLLLTLISLCIGDVFDKAKRDQKLDLRALIPLGICWLVVFVSFVKAGGS